MNHESSLTSFGEPSGVCGVSGGNPAVSAAGERVFGWGILGWLPRLHEGCGSADLWR